MVREVLSGEVTSKQKPEGNEDRLCKDLERRIPVRRENKCKVSEMEMIEGCLRSRKHRCGQTRVSGSEAEEGDNRRARWASSGRAW